MLEDFLGGFFATILILLSIFCAIGPLIIGIIINNISWLWLYCITIPILGGLVCILD